MPEKRGWFLTSGADWFVFVYDNKENDEAELTCISRENLHQIVDKNNYKTICFKGGEGMLVPIEDVRKGGGVSIWV